MGEKYLISIERYREKEKMAGKDWAVIGQDENNKNVYGYTPSITKIVNERDTIYTQIVDALDLNAVIVAVNGIQPTGDKGN